MNRPSRHRWRGRLLLVTWMTACVAGLTAMWSITDGRFEPPPVDPGGWSIWWGARDPIDAVASLCRLAASVALAYLAVAAAALLVTSLLSSLRITRIVTRWNPAPVAGLVAAATVASAPAVGASPAPTPPTPDDGASMLLVEDAPTMRLTDDGIDAPTMRLVEDQPEQPATTQAPQSQSVPAQAAPSRPIPAQPVPRDPQPGYAAAPATTDPGVMVIHVQPGDHLWDISERRVRLALGREPSEAEVNDYWIALIEVNADRFADRANPGLVLPGQELVLPG